ncbi:lycopene cyclase domain-containing protein [Pedobacter immunditicola]|uniref:lycopene cyclase domain-containing protein n=1 Tax=Pedobacter immunditicola TaxID=3133440 RepID=UPI0030963C1B
MNNSILFNLILILVPFLLAFDKKAVVFNGWKAIFPSVAIMGIVAVIIKIIFARYKLVLYDYSQTSGVSFFEVPGESALFCFTVPFAGICIYNYLNSRFPKNELEKYSLALSNIFLGLSIAIIFFAYTKAYTVLTFSLFLLLLLYIEYINTYRFMYRFYRVYGLFILLYALSQLLFNNGSTIAYHVAHTIKFNVAYVPFENYFLLGLFLLAAIYLFEFFKRPKHGFA